ncbi:hypothetical protein C1H46_005533 [Malus baccata]|uniref:Uncharacterized protein n=1 Tax=Malus baccata TaxID=106549 RepID=A0A540ND06_MALBA|nr:hypothetical protein C1H46_005533 [Malus baccata]
MARLPPDPKDAKTASKPEKEKRKKSEETIPNEVRPNISKKKSKLVGSHSGNRDKAPITIDLTFSIEEGVHHPSSAGGEEGETPFLGG